MAPKGLEAAIIFRGNSVRYSYSTMSAYLHHPCPTCLCEAKATEPPAMAPFGGSSLPSPRGGYAAAVCDLPMSVITRIDRKLRRCGLDPFMSDPAVGQVIDGYSRSYIDKREKSRIRSAAIRAAKKSATP
jgi:hypothetical protein